MTTTIEQSVVEEINRLYGGLQSLAIDFRDRAIRLGELLCDVKSKLKHGEFLPWLRCNLSLSERTAQNYMQFYKNRLLKSASFADLADACLMLDGPAKLWD